MMRRAFSCIFLFTFFVYTLVSPAAAGYDADSLRHRAEVDGVGYKTANLEILDNLPFKDLPGGYRVLVPPFVDLIDKTIKKIFTESWP